MARAVSVFGLLFMVVTPTAELYLLSRNAHVAFVPYEAFGWEPNNAWLHPLGLWGPTSEVRRFFGLLGHFRGGYRLFGSAHYIIATLAALIFNGLVDSLACEIVFVVAAALILVWAAVCSLRPFRTVLSSILTASSLTCISILAVLEAAATFNNSSAIEGTKAALVYAAIILILSRSIHAMCIMYREWRLVRDYNATHPALHLPRFSTAFLSKSYRWS